MVICNQALLRQILVIFRSACMLLADLDMCDVIMLDSLDKLLAVWPDRSTVCGIEPLHMFL